MSWSKGRRVCNREADQSWTQVIVMKLGTLQCAIYRVGLLVPCFPERLRLASSIDKVGVIASEPVACICVYRDSISRYLQLHNQSGIIITNSNKDHKGASLYSCPARHCDYNCRCHPASTNKHHFGLYCMRIIVMARPTS